MRRLASLLAAAATLVLAASACGDQTARPRAEAPTGLLSTRDPVTVLDDGDGAELCLGDIAASMPPQCGGPALRSWDWDEHDGDYEDVGGTRWGEFVLTGRYADGVFTPTDVVPADETDPPAQESEPSLATPCPEPDGGWRVLDPALTTPGSLDRTMRAARRLDGYAMSWLDQSRNPASTSGDPATVEAQLDDPALLTVNVQVTGDPAAAERVLRQTWGGALCVTRARHTDRELARIQAALDDTPGVLSTSRAFDQVHLEVVHDDGSLQRTLDERYGAGTVVVTSALQPVS